MRLPENGAASATVWLEYAERDLAVARDYVDDPLQSHASCFHAQQAARRAPPRAWVASRPRRCVAGMCFAQRR